MKYEIQRTSAFVKDYKRAVKRGCDMRQLRKVVELLANGETLPREYRDHALVNSKHYKGMRECHIEPDWLLVYTTVSSRSLRSRGYSAYILRATRFACGQNGIR